MIFPTFLYIDPSAGFQMLQQGGPFMGFLLAALAALLWPFKFLIRQFWNFFKKRPAFAWAAVVLIVAATAIGIYQLKSVFALGITMRRVIVLGMDGLDPDIVEKMMAEGKLPHFQSLKENGSYSRLGTVLPAQSPVAWSTFATGLNPGGHGLYDFLWRHTENYMPDLALSEFKPKTLKAFGKEIAIGKSEFVNRQKGKTLWAYTSDAGIPTTVIHCPVTFPVEKVSGAMLAGMGVPDIRGTQGTFSYYSDNASVEKTQGGRQILVRIMDGVAKSFLSGPRGEGGREISVPLEIAIDGENKSAKLSWPGGEEVVLAAGEWSPWVRVNFEINADTKITGMTRFYLRSISPHFSLYASAFNFTPENPIFPISYPNDYAKRLKESIGDFHTLGMPHDTWALNEGAMSDEMFLDQSRTVLDEEIKMLEHELPVFKDGLFVFVVETPDRIQHMFWRAVDKAHPLYTPEFAKKYGGVIEDAYRQMDEILGLVMNHVDDDTFLMVVSDHGFKSFRRAVHLNSWLRDNGFLIYKESGQRGGEEFFKDVDWSKSKAYAVGLGSIYLNLKGREKLGIIEPGSEADSLKREIAEELSALKDPKGGQAVVRRVFMGDDIFSGEAVSEAPDLLVGFEDGYRASWQTALGAAPADEIEDNAKKWSGDHIIDSELVPGIFFSNQKIDKANPSLYDLSPTVLSLFGMQVPAGQTGTNLFEQVSASS